jgi:hypothetical protein
MKSVRPAREHYALTRTQIVHGVYHAFASGDRGLIEQAFADEFTFFSPFDVGLDRAGYFDPCWPGAGRGQQFNFVRIVESGDEVFVTYEVTNANGGRGRNTEIFTFRGDKILVAEVYFGWTVLNNVPDRTLDDLWQLIRCPTASQLFRFSRPYTETGCTHF